MKTKSIAKLRERAARRPAGYVDDVLSKAESVTETHYTMTDEAWLALVRKYRPRLPLQKIPADFDPEQERRRMNQGGCCSPPGEG